jgi:hypothetical protein
LKIERAKSTNQQLGRKVIGYKWETTLVSRCVITRIKKRMNINGTGNGRRRLTGRDKNGDERGTQGLCWEKNG